MVSLIDGAPSTVSQDGLSKNQQKKIKRQQAWEGKREDRKLKRKEKRHERSNRRRELIQNAYAQGIDPKAILPSRNRPESHVVVPIAIILDCDFEQYMLPDELVSLAGQLIRCYADNRRARFQSHIFFSSYNGKLKERFETVLQKQHEKWIGAHFIGGDYRVAAMEAHKLMHGPEGGELIDLLKGAEPIERRLDAHDTPSLGANHVTTGPNSIIYLTSDSPNILTTLEPYTSYVVGGLVDRNREKGLCYRRAVGHSVRTAKLPIAEHLSLSTRHVLTTNQVVEIILNWIECGDWGSAFLQAIPQRKGGLPKTNES